MTEAIYPQIKIVTERLLKPETTERLLNEICGVGGIRRMILNGPRIPATVPSGPARGLENPHEARRTIRVMGNEFELQVQVGTVILELEDRDRISAIREACDRIFKTFSYNIIEGRFMKTQMTVSDYAKYGPGVDERILGITEYKSKGCPIILQGFK
ncbi:MAG: methyl-coenzyme M reductase operon protein D [Methanomicrobiales archaeon]|nr:methyl-coenzyme M reductase operon protein D [Methanomicrobiales archaeon]MDI6875904.1 methyl-coenzyme M reductase operon protein D [Methanomicrobiales archaeon]